VEKGSEEEIICPVDNGYFNKICLDERFEVSSRKNSSKTASNNNDVKFFHVLLIIPPVIMSNKALLD
jgi:hypothetical protein